MTNINKIKGLVSIGIPTYNRPEQLRYILKIVTNQIYRNLEIIISDNASPGNDVKEVVDFFLKNDSRIKYYRQNQNIGILKNFDFVLKQSVGEYFTFISDDDWRAPEFIETLVNLLEINKGYNWAFCDYHEVYEDGNFADGYPFTHLPFFRNFRSSFRIVRTVSHYWQSQVNGKCNLFYSLFRKETLEKFDIENLSYCFTYLGVDNLLVFKLLENEPIVLSHEVLCTITCKNQKHYLDDNANNRENIFGKFYFFVKNFLIDYKLYIKNSNYLDQILLFSCLLFPKLLNELVGIFLKKYFPNYFKVENDTIKYFNKLSSDDYAENRKKLELNNVTLVSVDTRDTEEALQALLYSSKDINFGSIKLLSNYTPFCKDKRIQFFRIPKFKNIDEWCYFIMYELYKFIDTEFILLIHADGFVVNPSSWRDQFLDYDYIGSPWPIPKDNYSYRDNNGNLIRVGNSVSIRSKKILELPTKLSIPWVADHGFFNEDGLLCCTNRHLLEANGIRFAPLDVAKFFGHEKMIPEVKNIIPFVFHKWDGTNSIYPKFLKRITIQYLLKDKLKRILFKV
jgi:glycosyltransferase involved in cell wall biosynthesis